jgi:hypothetical protein
MFVCHHAILPTHVFLYWSLSANDLVDKRLSHVFYLFITKLTNEGGVTVVWGFPRYVLAVGPEQNPRMGRWEPFQFLAHAG